MEVIKNDLLNEQYYRVKHKSGATILLYPMENYSSAYALFGTKYGSVDTTFKTVSDDDYVTVPEGIAHYLEHKLFENDECNAFVRYAKTGASANAYTSFDTTAYLFSCSQKFEENLEILLSFVQDPYFTDENVAKEQGIIGQEIRMYQDNPGWRVAFNCLDALYFNNPVRIDIAGTIDSIAKIDKELLYRCYNTFYNLNNMVIALAGNFDKDKALEICDRLLISKPDPELSVIVPDEPREVKKKRVTQKLSCAKPMFTIGYKLDKCIGREFYSKYLTFSYLLSCCFGAISEFYEKHYNSGLINDNFSASVFAGRGFFALMIDGESDSPDKVLEEVKAELYKKAASGISLEDFDIVKNEMHSALISDYNNAESIARSMMDYEMKGIGMYDMMEIAAGITLDDVNAALKSLDIENCSISVIEPIE